MPLFTQPNKPTYPREVLWIYRALYRVPLAVKGTLEAVAAGADGRPFLAAQVNVRAQGDCYAGKGVSLLDQLAPDQPAARRWSG